MEKYASLDKKIGFEWKSKSKISLSIILFVVFVGDTARGIIFPTLWARVSKFRGSESTLGFIVAAFSLGRVISSPLFGKLTVTMGYRKVLILAISIMTVGCIAYVMASNNHTLFISQMIIGIGSGTLGVTRAFVAENSSKETRTSALSQLTALQYAGFTATPAIGAHLCLIFGSHSFQFCGLLIDEYTAPAWCMLFFAIVAILLLAFLFHESVIDEGGNVHFQGISGDVVSNCETQQQKSSSQSSVGFEEAEEAKTSRTSLESIESKSSCGDEVTWKAGEIVDPISSNGSHIQQSLEMPKASLHVEFSDLRWHSLLAWGFFMNIITKGSVACYETLGTIIFMDYFGFSKTRTGFVVSLCGLLGVFSLLSMARLCKYFSDACLVFGGCLMMLFSGMILCLGNQVGVVGSIVSFLLMYSFGYPVGHTVVIGMFSKIVGAKQKRQGPLLGWFGSAGSVARILFPILSGLVAANFDPTWVFFLIILAISISLIVLAIFWNSLRQIT